MAKAALISGADGLMIEIHPNPKKALSDGSQALTPEQFTALVADLRKLAPFTGVTI
jgi:3-deoxy-7-phosphoheptulonate synthase